MNSQALFADSVPLRVSIPTPSAEERAKRRAKKGCQAKASKGSGPIPSNTIAQEGPSKPSSERLTEIPPSHPLDEIVGSEEVSGEGDELSPQDRSVTITISTGITLDKAHASVLFDLSKASEEKKILEATLSNQEASI